MPVKTDTAGSARDSPPSSGAAVLPLERRVYFREETALLPYVFGLLLVLVASGLFFCERKPSRRKDALFLGEPRILWG